MVTNSEEFCVAFISSVLSLCNNESCLYIRIITPQCNSSSNRSPHRIQCNSGSNGSPYRIQCNSSSNGSPYRIQCNSSSNGSPYRIQCNSSSNRSPYYQIARDLYLTPAGNRLFSSNTADPSLISDDESSW